ncbi:hypothetical protein AMTRI_Chr09g33560 [Amborella trichopoda]
MVSDCMHCLFISLSSILLNCDPWSQFQKKRRSMVTVSREELTYDLLPDFIFGHRDTVLGIDHCLSKPLIFCTFFGLTSYIIGWINQ